MRLAYGPDHGAFYHKFFQRDKPHLAAQMYCKNARTMFAMASDAAEKKAEAKALLKMDFVKPISPQPGPIVNPPSPALLPESSISSLKGGPSWALAGSTNAPSEMRQLERMALDSFLIKRLLNRALIAPMVPSEKITLGETRIGGSATSVPLNLSFNMLLQLEKVKQDSLLVERALKMQQEQSHHEDRLLQERRMMVASLQQYRRQQQREQLPYALINPGPRDHRGPNHNRTSAA
jgi:hypothetical protein